MRENVFLLNRRQLTWVLRFMFRAGKSGSSSLTSLIGGTWPLRRYSLKSKPANNINKKQFLLHDKLCNANVQEYEDTEAECLGLSLVLIVTSENIER